MKPFSAVPRLMLERRTKWPSRIDVPTRRPQLRDNAYEPRWFMHTVHMNPEEAVQAHAELGAAESIGMHFGTFQLTTEGIDVPVRALEEARRARNLAPDRFRAIGFGDSVRLP